MSVPVLAGVQLSDDPALPLLILGPSLGTSSHALWEGVAASLGDRFHLVGWDLPGHGHSSPAHEPFTIGELAEGVLALVEDVLVERDEARGVFAYAGVSLGGAVGLQLLVDHPGRVGTATLLGTGARIGTAPAWSERAALVRSQGTAALVEASAERWFAPGFIARDPSTANTLLLALQHVDAPSYAWACEALAEFDVREQLGAISTPVLAVAGAEDQVTDAESLGEISRTVRRGRLVVLDDVAHLAPAEAPAEVARLIASQVGDARSVGEVREAGMAVRRAVLGNAHVDRATANTTELTEDFQDLITQYAWGSIWTRPGLDRRSRSLITLTALVARGHHTELAMHLRAAKRNGLTDNEIKELLLQTAIYCGVPDANTAFGIAQEVLLEGNDA